jgi:hypothetical protein
VSTGIGEPERTQLFHNRVTGVGHGLTPEQQPCSLA